MRRLALRLVCGFSGFLCGAGALLDTPGLVAQRRDAPQRYSTSPEYQGMLQELRQPAPSPVFLATGERPAADPRLELQVKEDGGSLAIATAAAELRLDKASGRLSWHNQASAAQWTMTLAEGCAPAGQPSTVVESVARHGNVWSVTMARACGGVTATLELLTERLARLTLSRTGSEPAPVATHVEAEGPLFGLGERFWQSSLRGTQLDVRPLDRAGEPGHNWVYVAVPLVYSPGGLGLYADTAFDARFAFTEASSAFDMKLAGHPVALYLFTETQPKAVLRAYTALTGRPENPPLWAFGPWITALQGKGAVLDMAARIRVDGVPASALWIYDELEEANNLGWPFWFGSYYGDARTFTDTLHGLGYKVLTYVHPYVRQQVLPYTLPSPTYDKGVAEHLLMTDASGQPAGPRFETVQTGNIDFTNPAAVDWWQGMIASAVRDQGFDGWMEDFGEWVRNSDRFAAGSGATLSEVYPLLYHKVTRRVTAALNPDVVAFSRSGSAGSQQFSSVLWGADQLPNWSRDYGLPSVVTAGITAGMSGFSTWGPDILSTGDSRELWMRWVEFGALTPVMRDHVWNKPEHTFNLWSDADTTALFRKYAVLHSALLPYFATYADEAHRTGVPIMRHTVLEYPEDARSATAEYQYLLGEQLLIAPVVTPGAAQRTVALPRGEWVNFWTGDSLTGGQDVTVPAAADTIPILVRAGSILPFKPEREAAHWNWSDPALLQGSLVWRAYLSSSGATQGSFRMPDGTSAQLRQSGGAVTLAGTSPTVRDYEIVLRTRLAPESVELDGKPFRPYTGGAAGRPASQWWWNPSTSELHLVLRAAAFRIEVHGATATQYTD